MAARKKYFGEMLLDSGAITSEQLNFALKLQKQTTNKRLGDIIKELGYASEEKIMSVLDFISGMTDVFALDLYRTIKGIELPVIN